MTPSRLFRWRFTSCCGDDRASAGTAGATRREFITLAAGGAAGLAALGTLRGVALAQGRVFPPPPPAVSPVEGLIDFHVHCAPDVFGRSIDDDEAVTDRKSTRLNSSHLVSSYAVFCLKKKKNKTSARIEYQTKRKMTTFKVALK